MKKHIKQDLLPAIPTQDDMEFFITFACRILETYEKKNNNNYSGNHGQPQQQQQPKTRVFCQALWSIATPAQWLQWKGWMKQSLSPTKYRTVMGAIEAYEMEQNSAWC